MKLLWLPSPTIIVWCIITSAATAKQTFVHSRSIRSRDGLQSSVTTGLLVNPVGYSSARKLVVGTSQEEEICEENGVAVISGDSPHYKPRAIDVLNQGTTSVILTATQIFANNPDGAWTSFVYKGEDGNMVCQQKSAVPFGYSRSFKVQCEEDGFATVDVYVSSADWTATHTNPDAELCESWPASNAELFSYKISCGVCDGCSPPPDVEVPFDPEDEICEGDGVNVRYKDDDTYKPGAISILHQGTSEVIFTLTQVFNEGSGGSLVSVVYQDTEEERSWTCKESDSPLAFNFKRSYKAACDTETGLATVDVYVHNPTWSSNMLNPRYTDRPGVCAKWPSNESPSGVALFSYSLSCGVCTDCAPPPTAGPTAESTVEVPFDPEDEVCEGDGVNVRYKDDDTYKPGAISILHQGTSEVIFTLTQVFNEGSGGSLVSVVYQDTEEDRSWTCKESGSPLAFNFKRSYKAACDAKTGLATVDVYVHNPTWSSNILNPRYTDRPGVCDTWPSNESPSGVALFSYALSCGVCADCSPPPPNPPPCPNENKLISTIGQTMFPKWPIVITAQNDFSVTFELEQTWTERATIFTQFDHDALGTSQCYQATEVEKNSKQTFTAICLPTAKVAMIHVWVVDESFSPKDDSAIVPDCCYSDEAPEYPAVQYTFLISCKSLCPEEVARRSLLRGGRLNFLHDL